MTPPPDDRPVDPPPPLSVFEARRVLQTDALADADRMAHLAEFLRMQILLAGWDAMVQEETDDGVEVTHDCAAAKGFHLHQSFVLRISRHAAEAITLAGLRVRDGLPAVWAVFGQGGCSQRAAELAAEYSYGLSAEKLLAFDLGAAGLVQEGRTRQIEKALETLVGRLDPAAAAERHRSASTRRWVGARPRRDGQATLTIDSTALDVAAMYDVIRRLAVAAHGVDGETRTLGQLMADIACDLILRGAASLGIALPNAGPVDAGTGEPVIDPEHGPSHPADRIGHPSVPGLQSIHATVLVTIPADVATGQQPNGFGEVAGAGAVDSTTATRVVAATASWTRVVTDPVDDAVLAVDTASKRIPEGLKRLLWATQPTCTGDGCGLPAHRADIDHVTRREHGGRTTWTNLQVLCRFTHQAKDGGYADVRIGPNGRPHWHTKWGAVRSATTLKVRARAVPEECPF